LFCDLFLGSTRFCGHASMDEISLSFVEICVSNLSLKFGVCLFSPHSLCAFVWLEVFSHGSVFAAQVRAAAIEDTETESGEERAQKPRCTVAKVWRSRSWWLWKREREGWHVRMGCT